MKRKLWIIRALAALMVLMLALPIAASAAPSTAGCTGPKSPDGKHAWIGRERPAWCEIPGGIVYVCQYCGKEVFEQSTPALGHNWGNWDTIRQADCTHDGERVRYCRRCQKQEKQSLPGGHKWGEWKLEKPGTCIQKEMREHTCKVCGERAYQFFDYGDHDWDEGKVTKAPTATEDGEMTYTCKNDPSHTKTGVIPATGGEEKPALTINLSALDYYTDEKKTEFKEGEVYWFHGTVTNTGNVDIEIYNSHNSRSYGWSLDRTMPSRYLLKPGETVETWDAHPFLGVVDTAKTDKVTPGTQTETLAGTITYTATVPGYRPGTDEVICSDTASCTIGVLKPENDGPHPALLAERTWADDAGVGKRYEGAKVKIHAKETNVGDCDVFAPYHSDWAYTSYPAPPAVYPPLTYEMIKLAPGQSLEYDYEATVNAKEVEKGVVERESGNYAAYIKPDNKLGNVSSNYAPISIPLTYPDGEEPEEAKPGLTIEWKYDCIFFKGVDEFESTTDPGVLAPDACPSVMYYCINSGNVPLIIDLYKIRDIGTTISKGVVAREPGFKTQCDLGYKPVKNHITPGTETEDLLGTATISVYAIGRDPETGEELCKSNTLTRTWKVGKDSPWPIPEESKLAGTLTVAPGYESSDPAGYQLGEEIETVLTVKNTGLIDLDTFGVSDPWDSANFSDGPIAVNGEKSYVRAHLTVTEPDVERGYIEFPMITITWTDPDSEKERTAFAGPLHLTVLKKTGLLLKKGVAFGPAEGEYFKEGEPIQWSLTVANNSKEPVKNVTVEDQGKNVGSYAEIVPADTKNCTVPVHIVTEYEAKVVGYVLNSATATGTDYRGITRTWPSNVAKALTKKPADPDGDPKGDIDGLHPAVTIVKAEDPHGPLNGSYYEANEKIDYIITIRNTGDTELKDIRITDSLAGYAPIGTLASLAPGAEKSFNYSYTVKESDVPGWLYNTAVVNYTFGDNVSGTPRSSTVQSMVGEGEPDIETPHLDPDLLPGDEDYCALTLDSLSETEARYTLHACAEHLEAAQNAEQAALSGDHATAAEIWRAEVDHLYEVLYEAADSELKGALLVEKAAYDDYVNGLLALSAEAAANELRVKCAFLCCALHTTPEALPMSLAGDYAQLLDANEQPATAREFGELSGSDSEVVETYMGSAAYAQKNVKHLLNIESAYAFDQVFARGIQLWQKALDTDVNAVYKAADKDTRKKIANWRISLDTLKTAEEALMGLLYEGNDVAIQETLMGLYKDAVFHAGKVK